MDQREERFLDDLHEFLSRSDVTSFFVEHPNRLTAPDFRPPSSWSTWWDWPTEPVGPDADTWWQLLWRYYSVQQQPFGDPRFVLIPPDLRKLIDEARRLQLRRERTSEASIPSANSCSSSASSCDVVEVKIHGMSPKKAHEVTCAVEYTRHMLQDLAQAGVNVRHVVDVGAGQAYLSRALRDDLGLHVLALDWSPVQSQGATRREKVGKKSSKDPQEPEQRSANGTLTYETLPINRNSLLEAIDEWITAMDVSPDENRQVPVLLVALHACGSLTLDIFRAFVSHLKSEGYSSRWTAAAALVVGCCYNLLAPSDQRSLTGRHVVFVENHLQMAAQVPSQWCRTPEALSSTKLAFQKTAWRALLAGILLECGAANEHEFVGKRLGRVNDSAYEDWTTFLAVASQKFGVDVTGAARDRRAEGRVEVFHFLRCVLGAVVESFLLLDRKVWLSGELKDTGLTSRLVNLFDQSTGSARNVAVVVASSQVPVAILRSD